MTRAAVAALLAGSTWTAAQSPEPISGLETGTPDPIVLVEPDERPGSPIWPSLLAVTTAAGLAGAAWTLWRRADAAEPGDAAFRRVARALRLSPAERRLVRVLSAAHGVASPVALLLSGHALEQACDRFGDARRGPTLARLRRKLTTPAV